MTTIFQQIAGFCQQLVGLSAEMNRTIEAIGTLQIAQLVVLIIIAIRIKR